MKKKDKPFSKISFHEFRQLFRRVRKLIRHLHCLGGFFFLDEDDIIGRALEYIVKFLAGQQKINSITCGEFEALLTTVAKWRTIDALRAWANQPVIGSTDEPSFTDDDGEQNGEEHGAMAHAAVDNWRHVDFAHSSYGAWHPGRPSSKEVIQALTRITLKILDRQGVPRPQQTALLDAFFTELSSRERAERHGLPSANYADVSKHRCLKFLMAHRNEYAQSDVLVERFPFLTEEGGITPPAA